MWTSHKVKCSCDSIYSYIKSHKLLCFEIKFLKTKDFFSNIEADNNNIISSLLQKSGHLGLSWKLFRFFQHLQIRLKVQKGELTFIKNGCSWWRMAHVGWYQKRGFPITRPIVCNIYWWFPVTQSEYLETLKCWLVECLTDDSDWGSL